MKLVVAVAVVLASAPAFRVARACGGGPCATPLVLDVVLPEGSPAIGARANFALVYSEDGVGDFRVLCEEAWGSVLTNRYVAAHGQLLVASLDGLFRSDNGGCTWKPSGGEVPKLNIYDVAAHPVDPMRFFATARPKPTGTYRVIASADGAMTFDGGWIFSEGTRMSDVFVAPSQPSVVYGGGYRVSPVRFVVARSEDGGASFVEETPWPAGDGNLLAVSPTDSKVLYLGRVGEADAPDEIWRSDDGGKSAAMILRLDGKESIRGFAHGATLGSFFVAGRATSSDASLLPGTIYELAEGGAKLVATRRGGPAYRCLRSRAGLLYACAGDAIEKQPFSVGVSDDGGGTWRPVLTLKDLRRTTCLAELCRDTNDWLCDIFGYACAGRVDPPTDDAGPDGGVDPVRDGAAEGGGGGDGCDCRVAAPGRGGVSLAAFGMLLAARSRSKRARSAPRG